MDLIVLADSDGVVNKTPTAIAARTRMPIALVVHFLGLLQNPDSQSQTPDADGRRIELLDEHRSWGWHIINYQKYREIASEDQRKTKTRERVARFKLKRKQLDTGNAVVTLGNAGNAKEKEMEMEKKGERNGPLSNCERISLEKELKELKERIRLLKLDEFRTILENAQLKALCDRVRRINSALHIPL